MIDRRSFLKTTGALTMLWAGRGIPAVADDGSRVALVVGNNAYGQAPLDNPVNDAKAVGDLLRQANFSVDLRTDATRQSFLDGIDRFATAVSRAQAKLGLFYFAGHGAQLAWKNYLMPVDAQVATSGDLATRCIELNRLLQRLAASEGKTFIVILDACRNDPFGGAYRAEQQGLSQFDAPVGSLLAYATAPGSVASDGAGEHGLYTENLLKEFVAPQTSIEDALKRVRLGVRLASAGAQIPWESTSLEDRVVLFPTRDQSSDEEIERQFEEELKAWNAVKQSREIDAWVNYLRTYPAGRFSEVAQLRLNRLLAAREPIRPDDTSETPAAPAVVPNTPPIAAAVSPAQAANPYSAGTYRLARDYKLGDRISYRQSDVLTGVVERDIELVVTQVDLDADRVEFNDGVWVSDLNGNIQRMGRAVFDFPVQIFPAELQLGKHWVCRFTLNRGKDDIAFDLKLRIRVREKIVVPAGVFDAFRIDGLGWGNDGQRMEATYWVVPGINPFYVRRDLIVRAGRQGMIKRSLRHELVSHRQ